MITRLHIALFNYLHIFPPSFYSVQADAWNHRWTCRVLVRKGHAATICKPVSVTQSATVSRHVAQNNSTQKRCRVLWACAHFRWTEGHVFCEQNESKFWLGFLRKNRRLSVFCAKDQKVRSGCCHRKVEKSASVMVLLYTSVHGMSDLHMHGSTLDLKHLWEYLKGQMLTPMQPVLLRSL